jgi:hypothetical protein
LNTLLINYRFGNISGLFWVFKKMETVQEMAEETQVVRELNLLFEMTLRMEHELRVVLNSEE